MVIFINYRVYGGDAPRSGYSPTGLMRDAPYEKIIESGGAGYQATARPASPKLCARRSRQASRRPSTLSSTRQQDGERTH